MAFKSIKNKEKQYNDIESLFRDLPTHKIQSLYSYQADILRYYQDNALQKDNVAIELPTGSGKTLMGLLIAEFRRRNYGEKVLYLCPTRQLVNQVVELSTLNYGINCIAFTGSHRNFPDSNKFAYKNGDSIAVTTYSSLFNTNPWFEEPDLVILDDAHTSENYIASCWSLCILRSKNYNIYSALMDVIKDSLSYSIYNRMMNGSADYFDRNIIEKFPSQKLYQKRDEIIDTLSAYLDNHEDLKYQWLMLKDHLEACQLYFSWNEILIRPLIPPSLDNKEFKYAKQRIFMSATLGQGGDLERITGIKSFYKIPIPKGWDKQGMGRRFFMFPSLSLDTEQTNKLFEKFLDTTERTVILVSSDDQIKTFKSAMSKEKPNIEIFTALDIEKSKDKFVNSPKAAIILANRFDGIDFAGEESRLLFLIGIPYASNLQEKFLQSRMNASIIFYDRNRTRLIQAIGRCTRSPKDYSAICVLGDKDLSEWLLLKGKNKYLHPELQAEITFGIENSKEVLFDNFVSNYQDFIKQNENWKAADEEIIHTRSTMIQEDFSGAKELENTAKFEVEYQYAFWNKHYSQCFSIVSDIINNLDGGSELRGYRAFWHYQGGVISNILYHETGEEVYKSKSELYVEKLIRICPSASWSRTVTDTVINQIGFDTNLVSNIEYLQQYLSLQKINHAKTYNNYLISTENYISSGDLENLNLHIGKLLGFKSFNPKESAAPDPYWISDDNLVIVFEDKVYENEVGEIAIEDIRQATTHEKWIRENVKDIRSDAKVITVLVTNRTKLSKEGKLYGDKLKYWKYSEFIAFARKVISMSRDYSNYYKGENDSNWKDFFIEEFNKKKLAPNQIIEALSDLSEI